MTNRDAWVECKSAGVLYVAVTCRQGAYEILAVLRAQVCCSVVPLDAVLEMD